MDVPQKRTGFFRALPPRRLSQPCLGCADAGVTRRRRVRVGPVEEVGITGSKPSLQFLRYFAPAVLGALILSTAAPASAHTFGNLSKERRHIKRRAKRELGVGYSYGGTSPQGFDCSGFTRWTFYTHGADLPHSAAYQFDLGNRRGYKRIWKRTRLKKGDLLFFHTTSARVGHVGIYIGRNKFISATSSSGIHIDSVFDPYYWGSRWVGATRVPVMRRSYELPSTRTLVPSTGSTGSVDT